MHSLHHTFHITFWRPFSDDRPARPSPEWLQYRTRFLIERTLRSLAQQTVPTPVLIYVAPDVREDFFATLSNQNLQLPTRAIVYSGSLEEELAEARQNHDLLLLTRIDSDDLFHHNVAEEIQRTPNLTHWRLLIYRVGFIYNIHTQTVDRYIRHCPPFYTTVIPRNEKIDFANHMHMMAKTDPRRTRPLPAGRFVIMVHEHQDTSTWENLQQYARANRHKFRASDLVPFPENLAEFGSPDLEIV